MKKDYHNHEMEILLMGEVVESPKLHLQQLNEIGDKIQNPQYMQLAALAGGISQLHRLSEVLQNESKGCRDDLSTSFVFAETQIAKCIFECLSCSLEESPNIGEILSHVKDYTVVQPLPSGKHSLSLHKVHLILQDNYPSSFLCVLFNLLLCGRNNGVTKVITFN